MFYIEMLPSIKPVLFYSETYGKIIYFKSGKLISLKKEGRMIFTDTKRLNNFKKP